jgi:hypothetical protein
MYYIRRGIAVPPLQLPNSLLGMEVEQGTELE